MRPILGLLVTATVVHVLLLARHLMFVVPMAFDVLIAMLLTWAYVALAIAKR
ncbi:MAG TPA: hypothetical protein VNL18_11235 [Gemmatimonadales bacterium]|nr:hypothetical protein [Gemmatimonadales bacterium]